MLTCEMSTTSHATHHPHATHQVTWWDAFECTPIRVLEGSATGQINAVMASPDGEALVTGGGDKLVKLWG